MDRPLPQNRFLRGIYLMIQRYLRHNVGIQSAALAFYLLFTLFPLMIFISALLGLLDLNVAGILEALREILPLEILEFIGVYLTYVGENPSPQLLLFGLFFSLYFPMRATNALMRSVRTAYHLGPPRRAVAHQLKSLLYTVLLIVAIAVTLALMTVGNRFLGYAVENFRLPPFVAGMWARLRFPVAGTVGFFALFSSMRWPRMSASPGATCGRGRSFPWRRGWRCLFATRCMWITLPTTLFYMGPSVLPSCC